MLRQELTVRSQHVVDYLDLAVTSWPGAYAYCGHTHDLRHKGGQPSRHRLQDDRESTGLLKGPRIFHQLLGYAFSLKLISCRGIGWPLTQSCWGFVEKLEARFSAEAATEPETVYFSLMLASWLSLYVAEGGTWLSCTRI